MTNYINWALFSAIRKVIIIIMMVVQWHDVKWEIIGIIECPKKVIAKDLLLKQVGNLCEEKKTNHNRDFFFRE